jgi:hypothetical protein
VAGGIGVHVRLVRASAISLLAGPGLDARSWRGPWTGLDSEDVLRICCCCSFPLRPDHVSQVPKVPRRTVVSYENRRPVPGWDYLGVLFFFISSAQKAYYSVWLALAAGFLLAGINGAYCWFFTC